MEFPVAAFERLRDPLDGIYDIQTVDQIQVQPGGVADQSKDRLILANGYMDIHAHSLEPFDQMLSFVNFHLRFQNYDHYNFLQFNKKECFVRHFSTLTRKCQQKIDFNYI